MPTLNIFWCVSMILEQKYDFVRERYFHAQTYLYLVNIYMLSYSRWICVASINLRCSVLTFIIDYWLYGKKVSEKVFAPFFFDVSGNKQLFLPQYIYHCLSSVSNDSGQLNEVRTLWPFISWMVRRPTTVITLCFRTLHIIILVKNGDVWKQRVSKTCFWTLKNNYFGEIWACPKTKGVWKTCFWMLKNNYFGEKWVCPKTG